jgi:hypothetical protein
MLNISFYICRKLRHRRISLLAHFFESLHRDSVQIAIHQSPQRGRIRLVAGGNIVIACARRGQLSGERRGILFRIMRNISAKPA